MPLNDFLNVLDSMKDKVSPAKILIALTGGEPFMREDLLQCGKELARRGYRWGMVTNGWLFSEEKFSKLVRSGLSTTTVSIDGLEANHDWMRGVSGSFKKAYRAAEIISAEKRVSSDVVTCVNRRNISDLSRLWEDLIIAGVRAWRFFSVFAKGRAAGDEVFDLSPDEFLYMMEFIKETNRSYSIRADFSCKGYLGPYEGIARKNLFFCRAGINIAGILADGSISACPRLRGDYIQGNIYKDDFLTIWNRRYQKMRDRSWMKSGECEFCDQFRYCGGNGLHLRDEKTGKLLRCHYKLIEKASR